MVACDILMSLLCISIIPVVFLCWPCFIFLCSLLLVDISRDTFCGWLAGHAWLFLIFLSHLFRISRIQSESFLLWVFFSFMPLQLSLFLFFSYSHFRISLFISIMKSSNKVLLILYGVLMTNVSFFRLKEIISPLVCIHFILTFFRWIFSRFCLTMASKWDPMA